MLTSGLFWASQIMLAGLCHPKCQGGSESWVERPAGVPVLYTVDWISCDASSPPWNRGHVYSCSGTNCIWRESLMAVHSQLGLDGWMGQGHFPALALPLTSPLPQETSNQVRSRFAGFHFLGHSRFRDCKPWQCRDSGSHDRSWCGWMERGINSLLLQRHSMSTCWIKKWRLGYFLCVYFLNRSYTEFDIFTLQRIYRRNSHLTLVHQPSLSL